MPSLFQEKEQNTISLYRICNADDAGAIGLKKEYESSSPTCIHVQKAPHEGEQAKLLAAGYALKLTRTSGNGWSFGTAREDSLDSRAAGTEIPLEPEKLVLSPEGKVLGYCWGTDGGIFLPLNGGYRKTDYTHEYQVFPADGTSSEYVSSTYIRLESRLPMD